MNYKFVIFIFLLLCSCTVNNINQSQKDNIIHTQIFSNKGFALVFTESLRKQKIINKKIDDRSLIIFQKNLY